MSDTTPFTILVVDDEPPICEMLSRIAQKEFPQAHFVNTRSPQETLDYLDRPTEPRPRLILLDIDLRQTRSGLDILGDLRARIGSSVPIIMFSVLNEEDKVNKAYEAGAVAYTQKPDDLPGWQRYVQMLRDYWYNSARLPSNFTSES